MHSLLALQLVRGDLILENTGPPCPGETVSLVCTVESLAVVWDLPDPTRDIDIDALTTVPIERDQFTVTFINRTSFATLSILSFPASDGVTVGCYPRGQISLRIEVTIQVAGEC